MINKKTLIAIGSFLLLSSGLRAQTLAFEHQILLPKNSSQVRAMADFNGDRKGDLVVIEGEFEPKELAWFAAPNWKKYVINAKSLQGLHYVADASTGDVDGDGDQDIIIPDAHEGKMRVLWYENTHIENKKSVWTEHVIADLGDVSWLKDIEVDDLNNDDKLDVVVRGESDLFILYQNDDHAWSKVHLPIKPHEGLAIGDMDRDGFTDIVSNGFWLKNPGKAIENPWSEITFDAKWYNQATDSWQDNNCQLRVGDINADGLLDIVIAHSEKAGYPVSWYKAPVDPINGTWKEQVIDSLDFCHTVQLADFDNDGDIDVLAAEMIKGDDPDEMNIYLNDGATRNPMSWKEKSVTFSKKQVQTLGAYWAVAGDLEGDGDIDILSSRSYDKPPIEIWKNTFSDKGQSLDKWTYIEVDDDRHAWGEFDEPEWLKYFGITAGDLTGDGYAEIISGRYCYHNPGGEMTGSWNRIDFGMNVDAMLVTDVDGDDFGDIIAEALPNVYWIEATDQEATSWTFTQIAQIPPPGHQNSQGFAMAQIIPGGKPEILLEGVDGVYSIQVPASPESGAWPTTKLTAAGTHAEGIGTGDIDGDGYIDLATGKGWLGVVWWKNPGDGSGEWSNYEVGTIEGDYMDKLAIADVNGDGRNDIIAGEELYPAIEPAGVYWFEQPKDPTGEPALFNWKRHTIASGKYTLNNMNIADMDKDGDIDIVTAEHAGTKNTFVYENDGQGNFDEHVIQQDKEGHGGAFIFDLDGDGDYDVVNITWKDFKFLHLFRNDAISK